MDQRSPHLLDRVGAAAGIVAVVLLVALFMVFPSLPAPDHRIAEIARKTRENTDALLFAAYVGALLSGALLLFGAALAARLRRAEGPTGGWWLLALVGIAASSIGIVGNALAVVFVRAVGHGAGGSELWVGYGADHWLGVLTAIPLALFLLGASMGARVTRALPRWVAWLGIAAGVLLVAGAGSVTGDEVDGGILGMPLLLGYLGLIVWIVTVSVTMARRPADAVGEPVAAVA